MVVDYIRHPYRCFMRLWADSDELTPVRWFYAPPGAKLIPGYHSFCSAIYDRMGATLRDVEDYSGIGEPWPQSWRRDPGRNSEGYLGLQHCGSAEAFLHGGRHGVDEVIVTDEKGRTPCCKTAEVTAEDGLVFGGSGFPRGTVLIHAVGLLLQGTGYGQSGYLIGGTGYMTAIVVTTETGAPSYSGISTLELDGVAGTVSSPAAGHARYILRPADATHPGIVSLEDQVLGAGDKAIPGGLAVLSDFYGGAAGLEVHGSIYAGGIVYFGGGNLIAAPSNAGNLQYDPSTLQIHMLIPSGEATGNRLTGLELRPADRALRVLYHGTILPTIGFRRIETGDEEIIGSGGGLSRGAYLAGDWMQL